MSDLASQELTWVRINYSGPDFELRTTGSVVASLQGVHGECGDQSWTFEFEGIVHRRVTVHSQESLVDGAVLLWRREKGGTLELPEGRTLYFGPAVGALPPRWDWLRPDGSALVHFRSRPGFDISEGLAEIEAEAAELPEMPLLLVLGEYLADRIAERRRADEAAVRHMR